MTIGIIGSGTMGISIAHFILKKSYIVYDIQKTLINSRKFR